MPSKWLHYETTEMKQYCERGGTWQKLGDAIKGTGNCQIFLIDHQFLKVGKDCYKQHMITKKHSQASK